MKKLAGIALFLSATLTAAHPGHGEAGLLHSHGEWLALLLALVLWKVLRR